jgi:hypothetical protein
MKVVITRTRMAVGTGYPATYAYDARVLKAKCPWIPPCQTVTIVSEGKEYYDFESAIRPREQWAMEQGWDRYETCLANEKAARPIMLRLAQSVYPELKAMTEWPSLWVTIPGLDESHDTRQAVWGPGVEG